MKFEVKNRYTGNVQFTAEIECDEDANYSVKLGLAARWGITNKANLQNADLSDADLARTNLVGADLTGADLRGADLTRADLRGADLVYANLSGSDLSRADLAGANLVYANLSGSDLSRADLAGANLVYANLSGSDLSRADLAGSDLADTNLASAHLNKEKDISLQGDNPILMLNPIGSGNGTLIAYKTNRGIYLRRGCFFGTMRDFLAAVQEKHGDRHHGAVYRAACQFIEVWAGD